VVFLLTGGAKPQVGQEENLREKKRKGKLLPLAVPNGQLLFQILKFLENILLIGTFYGTNRKRAEEIFFGFPAGYFRFLEIS